MSTPSTATITVPPNHQYYPQPPQYLTTMPDYHHNNNASYASGSSKTTTYSNGYVNNAAPPDPRLPAAASSTQRRPASQSTSQSHAAYTYDVSVPPSSSGSARKRRQEEPVDWERFFGGKPPKEIIVIDDDDDDDDEPERPPTAQSTVQPAAPAYLPPNPVGASASSTQHTDKRRKMQAPTAYDTAYNPQYQHSYSNTPYYEPSPRTYTGSTDRTNSYNTTTAPTSLSSNGTYLEEGTVGQKRKRTTRQAAADQKKREVATRPDPYSEYVPPPKPPLKAKDVYVPVIHDVSTSPRTMPCSSLVFHIVN